MKGITRVGDVLAVAHELDEETTWERDGDPPELSPAVVTWLARLALHHPQVSAAVHARTVYRWTSDQRVTLVGRQMGWVARRGQTGAWWWEWYVTDAGNGRAPSEDAARAEVDERLEAARYRLLGQVYRRGLEESPDPEEDYNE